MQVLKRIDQKNEQFLLYLRTAYIAALSLNLLYLYIIKKRIAQKKDQRKVRIPKEKSVSWWSTGEDEEEVEAEADVEMTYCEYDETEYKTLMRSVMIQGVLVSIGHLKWGIIHPMIIQVVAPIKGLFLNPLFVCYLRNKEVMRPFDKNKLFQKFDKPVETKKRKEE